MRDPEIEVEAVREALRGLIRQNERGFAWIDRKLGWSEATASQLLRGRIKLQMMHVFQIIGLFGVEPEDFFGSLYAKPAKSARRTDAAPPQEEPESHSPARGKKPSTKS